MTELLHAGSLAAAGVGACCVALDGPRPRVREIVLSVVMVLAMLDVVLGAAVVPVIVWSALTLALAMALAVRRRGPRDPGEPREVSLMRVLTGLGAILMATLMLGMSVGVPIGEPGAGGHHGSGGFGGTAMSAGAVIAGLGYASACVIALAAPLRRVHVLDRVQVLSMSGSVLLLALAALVG